MPELRSRNHLPQVLVLWNDIKDAPRGKTHALDCNRIDGFHWAKGGYRKVYADAVPAGVGRCGFCGGGRPEPGGAKRSRVHSPSGSSNAPADPNLPIGALTVEGTVRVRDEGSGQDHRWTIKPPSEANVALGKLSADSPIARALIGHVAGETVTVNTPRGPRRYALLEVAPATTE
jgi:hypothetical protein